MPKQEKTTTRGKGKAATKAEGKKKKGKLSTAFLPRNFI
jgi:hypothetical protein